jgi:NAD(P)H-hydrate epimerase
VPTVTAEEMREVDRVAVAEFGLGILQMMENAGRNLAANAMEMLEGSTGRVTVLAGGGGNGGGGLCCARHLLNRDYHVAIVVDREQTALTGAAASQLAVLRASGAAPAPCDQAPALLARADLIIDALIGYSLRGAPGGKTHRLIDLCNTYGRAVLSLDLPSGLDATTGRSPGSVVRAHRTLTLALPKAGLRVVSSPVFLADIGIPPQVYRRVGVDYEPPFGHRPYVRLELADSPG